MLPQPNVDNLKQRRPRQPEVAPYRDGWSPEVRFLFQPLKAPGIIASGALALAVLGAGCHQIFAYEKGNAPEASVSADTGAGTPPVDGQPAAPDGPAPPEVGAPDMLQPQPDQGPPAEVRSYGFVFKEVTMPSGEGPTTGVDVYDNDGQVDNDLGMLFLALAYFLNTDFGLSVGANGMIQQGQQVVLMRLQSTWQKGAEVQGHLWLGVPQDCAVQDCFSGVHEFWADSAPEPLAHHADLNGTITEVINTDSGNIAYTFETDARNDPSDIWNAVLSFSQSLVVELPMKKAKVVGTVVVPSDSNQAPFVTNGALGGALTETDLLQHVFPFLADTFTQQCEQGGELAQKIRNNLGGDCEVTVEDVQAANDVAAALNMFLEDDDLDGQKEFTLGVGYAASGAVIHEP